MLDYLGDLEQRNGTAFLELVAITLARVHFFSNPLTIWPAPLAPTQQRCWTPR